MKQLSKVELKERDRLASEVEELRDKLQDDITAYNEAMGEHWEPVQASAEALNEAINEAQGWIDEVYSEMDCYSGDRSERWHEGERGEAYAEWMSEFETQLDPAEVDEPDRLEDTDVDADAILNDLPVEPGC